MPKVDPFHAIQYNGGIGDVSTKVAPPYDVLDSASKSALLDRDADNIVAIDLPHVPAKELGPPETYERAAKTLDEHLQSGVLGVSAQPAMFAYRQTFDFEGITHQRCGMVATLETQPFGPREGGGVLPHEETFSGPKEDRFALMKETRAQLSPIFGLHADEKGEATNIVRSSMEGRDPDQTARTDDGVLHEVWTITDETIINEYRRALDGEDVFIADGHHRYTTAVNYLRHLTQVRELPDDHPARRTMFVLIGMSDPGLAIGPTHRVLGGMESYDLDAFIAKLGDNFNIAETQEPAEQIEHAMTSAGEPTSPGVLGLIDFASGRRFVLTLKTPDPLEPQFPKMPIEWRQLDVALVQHLIVKGVAEPAFNGGEPVKWAFPHTVKEVLEIGSGAETGAGGGAGFAQIGVIVRPTPLEAVRAISRANELMPQKSTFFYPKLATGLFFKSLED